MADADVRFGFDTSPFRRAMRTVSGGLTRLSRLGTGVFRLVGRAVTSTTGKLALLGAAFLGVRSLLKGVPEVGQAFQIAGDIFKRNFFEPIRRALLPLLQRLLDWVRDNRDRFLRWGQAVVSAFRTVIVIARQVFEVLERIGSQLIANMRATLGIQSGDFADFINLLTTKVVALVLFMGRLIGRFFDRIQPGLALLGSIRDRIFSIVEQLLLGVTGTQDIGSAFEVLLNVVGDVFNLVARVVDSLLSFVEAFAGGFFDSIDKLGGLKGPLGEIWEIIRGLLESIGLLGGEQGDAALRFFETLGRVAGGTLIASLNLVIVTLRTIIFAIETAINGIKRLFAVRPARRAELRAEQEERTRAFLEAAGANVGQIGAAGTSIFRAIVPTAEPELSPQDQQAARRAAGELVTGAQGVAAQVTGQAPGGGQVTNIDVGDVIVNPPPGTPIPDAVGNELHGAITEQLRREGE